VAGRNEVGKESTKDTYLLITIGKVNLKINAVKKSKYMSISHLQKAAVKFRMTLTSQN
jgi:hypothetical protein